MEWINDSVVRYVAADRSENDLFSIIYNIYYHQPKILIIKRGVKLEFENGI
jgi:hypothetical protein